MKVHVLKPGDAPPGNDRLLPILKQSLVGGDFSTFRFMVAFARLSGVARLLPEMRQFRAAGGRALGIVGVDHFGTSKEALEVLLEELDEAYITGTTDRGTTFHPKIYLFSSGLQARAVVGSHNLTAGGLETNFEGGIVFDLDLSTDLSVWQELESGWDQLLPAQSDYTSPLTAQLITDLRASGQIRTEAEMRAAPGPPSAPAPGRPAPPLSRRRASPPTVLARPFVPRGGPTVAAPVGGIIGRRDTVDELPKALVIELRPHTNGEVFLSKAAADAFPSFFGMPFTGKTTPRNPKNPPYLMREPDPRVELRLHDSSGNRYLDDIFLMNTVLYERNAEVRITIRPTYARSIPVYSILVMWRPPLPDADGLDYLLEVYAPGSAEHARWARALNLSLPGGGLPRPRKMGWI